MKPFRPSPLLFIFLTIFLDFMGGSLLVPILPYIVGQYRGDALTLGLLSASFSLAQFIASPTLGAISDRYGRRPVLLWSMFGTGVGYLVFGLAHTLVLLFVGRLIDGITGGVISTAQAYIADITKPEDRSKSFGLVGAAFGMGFILGPAIGGALATINLNLPVFLASAMALANTILGYFTLPESLPPEKRQTVPFRDLNPLTQLGNLSQNKRVRTLVFGFFLFNFAFAGFQNNFAFFTRDRFHWGPEHNALLFAYIGVISSLVQGLFIRRLIPRFGEAALARVGLGLCAVSIGGVALVTQAPWLFVTQALTPLGVGLCVPTLRGLISQRAASEEQGRVLGGTQSMVSLALVLGPLWAGGISDTLGLEAPYWSAGIWMFLALIMTTFALRKGAVT